MLKQSHSEQIFGPSFQVSSIKHPVARKLVTDMMNCSCFKGADRVEARDDDQQIILSYPLRSLYDSTLNSPWLEEGTFEKE